MRPPPWACAPLPRGGHTFPSSSCSGLTSWVKNCSPEWQLARGRWLRLPVRRDRHGVGGGRRRGAKPAASPALPQPLQAPFTFPTCRGRRVRSWQPRLLSGCGKRLHAGKGRLSVGGGGSGRGSPALSAPRPPYLGVLDQEPGAAMAVGALGTLPAASAADAAHAALTAHTVPVTCWRGGRRRVRAPVGPAGS